MEQEEYIVDGHRVMRPGVLRPEYWNAAHQLYFAVGGNGARASVHGTKVFCINIYMLLHQRWTIMLLHMQTQMSCGSW